MAEFIKISLDIVLIILNAAVLIGVIKVIKKNDKWTNIECLKKEVSSGD